MIWEWIKNKKVKPTYLKIRKEGDIVITYGKSLELCYLNNTAAIFLLHCNGMVTVSDIEQYMLSNFDVDAEILRRDLVELIRNLQWQRLILIEE